MAPVRSRRWTNEPIALSASPNSISSRSGDRNNDRSEIAGGDVSRVLARSAGAGMLGKIAWRVAMAIQASDERATDAKARRPFAV
jgi:hypothetical protein